MTISAYFDYSTTNEAKNVWSFLANPQTSKPIPKGTKVFLR
jgi:hypothetical protein